MVTESEIRRAAREMEERAKKAEKQLSINTKKIETLIRILQSKGVLGASDLGALARIIS